MQEVTKIELDLLLDRVLERTRSRKTSSVQAKLMIHETV